MLWAIIVLLTICVLDLSLKLYRTKKELLWKNQLATLQQDTLYVMNSNYTNLKESYSEHVIKYAKLQQQVNLLKLHLPVVEGEPQWKSSSES